MNLPTSCKPNCGHSKEEHAAFDAGLMAGSAGKPDYCPHERGRFRTAWQAGYTTGSLNTRYPAKHYEA